MMRYSQSKKGFTLAEMLIASMIFLFISTAFTACLLTALGAQTMAADYYKAVCLARNRVQRSRTLAFNNISMMAESNVAIDDDGNLDSSGSFRRTTIVSNISAVCIEVEVEVYFPTRQGLSPTPVEAKTMIAYGM